MLGSPYLGAVPGLKRHHLHAVLSADLNVLQVLFSNKT